MSHPEDKKPEDTANEAGDPPNQPNDSQNSGKSLQINDHNPIHAIVSQAVNPAIQAALLHAPQSPKISETICITPEEMAIFREIAVFMKTRNPPIEAKIRTLDTDFLPVHAHMSLESLLAAVRTRLYLKFHNAGGLTETQQGFISCDGQVIQDDNHVYKIQVQQDEDAQIKLLPDLLPTLHQALSKFTKSTDLFKAYAVSGAEFISIVMDPGNHKEYLAAIALSGTECLLLYEHTYSPYEAQHQTLRPEFVTDALSLFLMKYFRSERSIIAAQVIPSHKLPAAFAERIRLCRAVKNLDLVSESKAAIAQKLFQQGCTNIDMFLACMQYVKSSTIQNPRKKKSPAGGKKRQASSEPADAQETVIPWTVVNNAVLNPHEQQLLKDYQQYLYDKADARKHGLDLMQRIRKGKTLNYKILHNILLLQELGRKFFTGENVDNIQQAQSLFDSIEQDLKKMLKNCPGQRLFEELHITRLADQFRTLIEKLSRRAPIRDIKAAQQQFQAMFNDEKKSIKSWNDVENFAETVRFLHHLLYASSGIIRNDTDWAKNIFCQTLDPEPESGLVFLDITTKELQSNPVYEIFKRTLRQVPDTLKREMAEREERYSYFVLGDDYAEIAFPRHHYIELATQIKTTSPEEYGITLYYAESKYTYAQQRFTFMKNAMEKLNFRLQEEQNPGKQAMKVIFRSSSRVDWETAFAEIIRLIYASSNIDIYNIDPNDADKIFFSGITLIVDFYHVMVNLKKTEINLELAVSAIQMFLLQTKEVEQQRALQLILQNVDDKKLLPILQALAPKEREKIITCLRELKKQAEDKQNTQQTNRLQNMLAELDAAI